MGKRSKNFEEVKVELYKKEKVSEHVEEMSCYVDSNRNIAVLLDSSALANERKNKKRGGESPRNVNSTLYFKQAKHFMKKKQYEKALWYLNKAVGLSVAGDETSEDGLGKGFIKNKIY